MAKAHERILIFADETYPDGTSRGRVVVTALAVSLPELERRQATIKSLAQLRARRQSKALKDFLDDRAFLVSVSTIDRSAVCSGFLQRKEAYPDVGAVSTTDDLWTQGFGYSVTAMIPLMSEFWPSWPISIYYEEFTLTRRHRESTHKSLQSFLPSLVAQESQRLGQRASLTIASVEEVAKPTRDQRYQLEHDGIWLAHAVGRLTKEFPREAFSPNFLFRDHTPVAVKIEAAKLEASGYNAAPAADV
jgi:hypothetical protein